ncbi:MAG: type II toxin-antitoxin system VapC family toxin [Anaerolineae bacterium]
MIILLDTNLLLRYVDAKHPSYAPTQAAVRRLRQQGHYLRTAGQNCIEFWNVSTRPLDRNGFGKTPADAHRSLRRVERLFPVLPELPDVYATWRQLVVAYGVSGVQVHDAHLVATMLTHSLTHILTFNTADFTRYTEAGIVVIDPTTI